jgi:hypothetical protein
MTYVLKPDSLLRFAPLEFGLVPRAEDPSSPRSHSALPPAASPGTHIAVTTHATASVLSISRFGQMADELPFAEAPLSFALSGPRCALLPAPSYS